jgi:hypothetical protein
VEPEPSVIGETEEVELELVVSKELGRPEHHEYRWVTFDEAEELTGRLVWWRRLNFLPNKQMGDYTSDPKSGKFDDRQ